MAIVGRIVASVAEPSANGHIEAHTSGTPDGHIDATIDLIKFDAVAPKSGSVQIVGSRISLDGNEIQAQRLASWRFTRSLDTVISQGSVSFAQIGGSSPLGSGLLAGAPATGLLPWLIELAYVPSDGIEFREPICTGGISDATQLTRSDTVIEAANIVDKTRLYRDVKVDLSLPSGHNIRRGEIARKLAFLAGDLTAAFPIMAASTKPIDISSGSWLGLIQSLFEIEGYRLIRDRYGILTARRNAIEAQRPSAPEWLFDERNILRSVNGALVPIRIFPAAEAWTKVSLKGTRQIIGSGSCGRQTFVLESVGEADSAEPETLYRQDGAGDVFLDPPPPITPPITGSKVLQFVTRECGTTLAEKTTTRALFNPGKARFFRTRDGGAVVTNFVCRLAEDSPTAIGFLYERPRLIRTSVVLRTRRFKALQGVGPKRIVSEAVTTQSLYNPRVYVDLAGGSPLGDFLDRGNGEGIQFEVDRWLTTEVITITYSADRDNFITSKREVVERFSLAPGATYIYADGTTSGDQVETFREVERRETSWKRLSEDLISVVESTWSLGTVALTNASTQIGTPPTVEIIDDGLPVRTDFATDQEFENALQSRKFDQQEIKGECEAPALLGIRPRRELLDAVMEWAESEGELGAISDRLCLLGLAPGVEFAIAANARLEEGAFTHIRDRTPGVNLDHDFKVETVHHEELADGALITRVRGVIWDDQGSVS